MALTGNYRSAFHISGTMSGSSDATFRRIGTIRPIIQFHFETKDTVTVSAQRRRLQCGSCLRHPWRASEQGVLPRSERPCGLGFPRHFSSLPCRTHRVSGYHLPPLSFAAESRVNLAEVADAGWSSVRRRLRGSAPDVCKASWTVFSHTAARLPDAGPCKSRPPTHNELFYPEQTDLRKTEKTGDSLARGDYHVCRPCERLAAWVVRSWLCYCL